MREIAENLAAVRAAISTASSKAKRHDDDVELIAVSKTFSADAIREAFAGGQTIFGENKLQEAETKIGLVPGSLRWHFVGRIQRNKMRKIIQCFDVIHTIDSLRLAAYASEIAGELGLFPTIYLQVNIGGEESKGGFTPAALPSAMEDLLALERLQIIGLMCVPPVGPDAESARRWFVKLRELRDSLEAEFGVKLPGLSMGMSGDYEVAIEEGATAVRVGSAIFGTRRNRL